MPKYLIRKTYNTDFTTEVEANSVDEVKQLLESDEAVMLEWQEGELSDEATEITEIRVKENA